MAGMGPAPKHPSARSRRHKSPEIKELRPVGDVEQPDLPEGIPWPDATVRWWQMWRDAPQSDEFGPTDWDFLMDTALLHADVWSGNLDRLPELRIRVAKFGATPEDRARLKIAYAEAVVAEDRATERAERRASRQSRRGDDPRRALQAVK